MSRPRFVPVTAERIRLTRTSRTRGYADVRLAAVHLCGFRVEERPNGSLNIRPPETTDEQGRTWPVFSLQPLYREAVEAEIAAMWAATA